MYSNSESIQLENDEFRARINILGAELKSLFLKEKEQEIIWPGKSGSWERSSPVLFPFVGKSLNNEVNFGGNNYEMPQHGFARDMNFRIKEQTSDSAAFVLESNEKTRKYYPFDFSLSISYKLHHKGVRIEYEVKNTGTETMLCSLGTHPGFNLPSGRNEDYKLVFEKDEELQRDFLEKGLLTEEQFPFPLQNRSVQLKAECFREDAWVFRNVNSRKLRIEGEGLGGGLTVSWENFPFLGIWSKYPQQEFICIEPWHGVADYAYPSRTREGLIRLEADDIFTAALDISIEKF